MANCLGISIQNHIIKYAKVVKDHSNLKVESFGIKFYDDLQKTLTQIIDETGSAKTPLSINLSEEMYSYFTVFSLLNKKDIKQALKTEFDVLCEEKGYNAKALDSRYLLTKDYMNKEKLKAIYISVDKAEIARKLQQLDQYKIGTLSPLPIALSTLIPPAKENVAIINIEDKTTLTTIIESEINNVDVINIGMEEILSKIAEKENSYQKAYDICKNTTIYTLDVNDSQISGNEYLEDIMPTLYKIVTEIKNIFDQNVISVQKIYLTGTATIINNIQMYFQEYLNAKCELLIPKIMDKNVGAVNIKDYIEVNSAIAVGIQGIGEGITDVNFKHNYVTNGLSDLLKMEVGSSKNSGKNSSNNKGIWTKIQNIFGLDSGGFFDFSKEIDRVERNLLRFVGTLILFILIFSIASVSLAYRIQKKQEEVVAVIQDTEQKISEINKTRDELKLKISDYTTKIQNLERASEQLNEQYKTKRAIPNLLSQIMSVIPKEVKVTSIQTNAENVTISAEAERYEHLGYFKTKLGDGILLNVKSSSGIKQESVVKITIEGRMW